MQGRERVEAALRGLPADRPGVAYQFFGGAHRVLESVGLSLAEVYGDADLIAMAQLAAAEMFGHDTASAPWGCLTVEAEAFGCGLEYYDMWYPQVRTRPLAESTDLSLLNTVGPELPGRMPLMVDALSTLRKRAGEDLFVIGVVVSPFLVACEVRDMSQLMMDFGVRPTFASDLLEAVTDGLCVYIDEIIATGACDALVLENAGMAGELLGPHHVETFIRPHHRRLVSYARDRAPDLILIEHNCSASPYFVEIQETDVDVVSFATQNFEEAVEPAATERGMAAIGMVGHTKLMVNGNPADVYAAARDCIQRAGGRPFVLSTGCEIPFKAPVDNIAALSRAAHTGF